MFKKSKVKNQKSKVNVKSQRSKRDTTGGKCRIILASKSPWRKRLLRKNGIDCRIHISDFKELKDHKSPVKMVLFNAEGKARAVAVHYKDAIIIGVDTIGVIGREIICKPKDKDDARRMLLKILGHTHKVISGVCIIDTKTKKEFKFTAVTKVAFRRAGKKELEDYLNSNHWKGKAGAYAIQGRAKKFLKKMDGELANVIGIPIIVLKKVLEKLQKVR